MANRQLSKGCSHMLVSYGYYKTSNSPSEKASPCSTDGSEDYDVWR